MANSTHLLDVIVSLIFIFTICALLASVVMEWISSRLRRREVFLRQGLKRLVQDYGLYLRIVNHPSVLASSGKKEKQGGPSYLSGADFARALLDSARTRVVQMNIVSGRGDAVPDIRDAIGQLEEWGSMTARAVRPMLVGDPADDERRIATWYDQAMDRITGNYKRATQAWLFWMGFVMAAALNIDTLAIAGELWRNEKAAQSIAAAAAQAAQAKDAESILREGATPEDVGEQLSNLLRENDIPFGYDCASDETPWTACFEHLKEQSLRSMFAVLFGWLLTAIAVSVGAPFWFDLLKKIVNVRNTGRVPSSTEATT